MRGTATKTALITAIEGTTLDSNAGGEELRYVDLGGADVQGITERVFLLTRTRLDLTNVMTSRVLTIGYVLTVFYQMHQDVGDRMHQDAERISGGLFSLHTTEPDICAIMVSEATFEPSELDGMNELSFEIGVKYQLDTGI
jgi:hypothetical protein